MSRARFGHGDSARDGGYLPGKTWICVGGQGREGRTDRHTDKEISNQKA